MVNMTKRDYESYLESHGVRRDAYRKVDAAERELISNASIAAMDGLDAKIKQVRLLRNRRIAYMTLGFVIVVFIATMTILLYTH